MDLNTSVLSFLKTAFKVRKFFNTGSEFLGTTRAIYNKAKLIAVKDKLINDVLLPLVGDEYFIDEEQTEVNYCMNTNLSSGTINIMLFPYEDVEDVITITIIYANNELLGVSSIMVTIYSDL